MKEIKSPLEIKKDLQEILGKVVDGDAVGNGIFSGNAFILSNDNGMRPLDIFAKLYQYVTGIALLPQVESAWFPLDEYQLEKRLNRGDIVRRINGTHAFTASGLYGKYAVVVDTTDIENLSEWQLQIDAAHQDFQDIQVSAKLIEVGNVLKHKGTGNIYTVTHVLVLNKSIVHIRGTTSGNEN